MKKVLVLALALLTVFAMVGCDSGTDDPGEESKGFVPPANWVGFSDAEYAAGQFWIGASPDGVTSITKKGSAYEVKIKSKTVASGTSSYTAVWFSFANTVFHSGMYVSLTLPTANEVRPINVCALPLTVKDGDGTQNVSWPNSQDAANATGDIPDKGTFDGEYVVGDLNMLMERENLTSTDFFGVSLQFYWPEDPLAQFSEKDYIFTINTIKVLPGEATSPPPPPEWEFEAPAGWRDLGAFTGTGDGGSDPANSNQPAWFVNGHNDVVTDLVFSELIESKFIVLVGNKEAEDWGYGGLQVNLNNDGTGWTVAKNEPWGGWLSYHYLANENVYFVIELAKIPGWDAFKSGTGTNGYFSIASWPKPSESIGFKKGFLVNDYPRPEDAYDEGITIPCIFLTKTLP
jgi:hypothetical protein